MPAAMDQLERLDQLERILDDANIGLWQLHVPSGTVTHNACLLRLMQSPEAQPIQTLADWSDRIHPDDRQQVLVLRQRLLTGAIESYWVDYRLRQVSGNWVCMRVRVSVVERDASGDVLQVCGVMTDISRERELSRLTEAIFERPFQFIGLLTPNGTIVQTNRRSLQSGQQLAAVLGKAFWDEPRFSHLPEVQARLRQGIARAAGGEPVRFELRHPNQAGDMRTLDFTLTPLRDDDGAVVNIIPEGRDISALAVTREALRATQQRLKTASEAANIGLWEADLGGGPAWFSDRYWQMLGYEPGELPATFETVKNIAHPDERARLRETLLALRSGLCEEFDLEFRIVRKDGAARWMQSKGRVIERGADGGALRVSGILVDVTERKEAQRRLEAAERLESLGRLAAGVAHEINTPLQYVNDNVYFIREGVRELIAHVQALRAALPTAPESPADLLALQRGLPGALESIVDGMTRVAEIVRSMKEFSHPDRLAMLPVDLNRAIQSTLVVARSEFKYIADLQTHFAELPPVVCHGGQINQVVLNLVVNAAHAIADVVRGSDRRGVITLKTFVDGADVIISVTDTGGGVAEAIRHRIFEPFFTTKEVGRGTGQGLAIARSVVVHGHGGALSFQTQAGQGSTFLVRLPIHQAGAALTGKAA